MIPTIRRAVRATTARLRRIPLEAAVWLAALAFLFAVDPAAGRIPDLCLFRRLGLDRCPGCGLGASVHDLLHGRLAASWSAHPLGLAAVPILCGRVATLLGLVPRTRGRIVRDRRTLQGGS